jgi:hypothetical protein
LTATIAAYIPTGKRLYYPILNLLYTIMKNASPEVAHDAEIVFSRVMRMNGASFENGTPTLFMRAQLPS